MAAACRCTSVRGGCLADEQWVTHLNDKDGTFRNSPRYNVGEFGMSVYRGQLTLDEAFEYRVGRRPFERERGLRSVRYTRVSMLREAGFAVVHTPGAIPSSDHCTVLIPSAQGPLYPEVPWSADVSRWFEGCFNEGGG